MVTMDNDNKLKPIHDRLGELTNLLAHITSELVKLREELHTFDGSQTRLDSHARVE